LFYEILFIRSFIYSETNTFGLHKFSKISFTFKIFVPIPVEEMLYLKDINKNHPNGLFRCREPSIKKRIWKNLGVLQPPQPPYIRLWQRS